jgi:hypothetical protein
MSRLWDWGCGDITRNLTFSWSSGSSSPNIGSDADQHTTY